MKATRISGANFSVTDGPFAETKELIGGNAIAQVKSKEEPVEWAKRFPKLVDEGDSEIHPMHNAPPL